LLNLKHAAAVLPLISAEAAMIPAVEALPVAVELANGCSEMEKQHLLLVPGGKMPLLPAMLRDVPLLTCVDLPFEQLGQLAEAGAGGMEATRLLAQLLSAAGRGEDGGGVQEFLAAAEAATKACQAYLLTKASEASRGRAAEGGHDCCLACQHMPFPTAFVQASGCLIEQNASFAAAEPDDEEPDGGEDEPDPSDPPVSPADASIAGPSTSATAAGEPTAKAKGSVPARMAAHNQESKGWRPGAGEDDWDALSYKERNYGPRMRPPGGLLPLTRPIDEFMRELATVRVLTTDKRSLLHDVAGEQRPFNSVHYLLVFDSQLLLVVPRPGSLEAAEQVGRGMQQGLQGLCCRSTLQKQGCHLLNVNVDDGCTALLPTHAGPR
jgi:hypothetical protein